jgi:hypothetical protein
LPCLGRISTVVGRQDCVQFRDKAVFFAGNFAFPGWATAMNNFISSRHRMERIVKSIIKHRETRTYAAPPAVSPPCSHDLPAGRVDVAPAATGPPPAWVFEQLVVQKNPAGVCTPSGSAVPGAVTTIPRRRGRHLRRDGDSGGQEGRRTAPNRAP